MTNSIQLSLIKDISQRVIIRFNLELTAVQIFMKLIRHSPFKSKKLWFMDVVGHRWVASLSNYDFNLTYRAGKANGDADPLSRIQPETKLMFHDAIKAVCSVCAVSASNPCIETVLLTQNVSIDDSLP
jgi:hypothetical protein